MIERKPTGFRVSGPVTIRTATAVLEEAHAAWPESGFSGEMRVDIGDMDPIDSAALSILLSWQRKAQRAGFTICFANLSPNLRSLADLYGVDDILTTDDRPAPG